MNDLNFNIYNLIIFSGILQGLIFSIVIFFNKHYSSKTNKYIALTVLVLSLSNLQYWFLDVGFNGIFSVFNKLRIPCDTLIAPFFYLYVNSFLKNKNRNEIIILLSIPFFISLIVNIVLYSNTFSTNTIFRTINIVLENLSFIYNLTLIILILYKIRVYERRNKTYNIFNVSVETKWLKNILYIGGAMCLFWFLEIIYMQTKYNAGGLGIYYPLWISISFLIYWISYVGILKSKIQKERVLIRNSIINTIIPKKNKTKS
ncbi:hypothetical protein [uncultured Algibacter sp.]|uniref:hypothetical protein n=1 Tax=uncultured Algibacter sp. TaxID=298659 RepID=UPI0026399F5C|nr:hypothetical protein [uncultured Algibacter sp.]